MQRKYIYGFIALSFAISMELVLALHLTKGVEGQPVSSQLVSTISIPKKHAKTASQNAGETPLEQETAYPVEYIDDSSGEEELDFLQDDPASAEGYPITDEDHPLGSEPVDSEGSDGYSSDNSYPPPYENSYEGSNDTYNDPWVNYPPPDSNNQTQPTPVPPTATLEAPTATIAPPTATQAPVPQATATQAATPVTPQATQPQAPTSPTTPPQAGDSVLVSARGATAPDLDGNPSDAAWADVQAVTVDTTGGANHSATRVTIKSTFDDENVYFLLIWADPSQSFLLNPWEKQNDGSWKKLSGADNQGGDENEFYQDKLALLWPVNNSLPGFAPGSEAGRGCGIACHSGEGAPDKALGLMLTGGPDQIGDLWQLKTVMNAGQVDDGYLDGTSYSQDSPWAGFHGDPGKGGYRSNQTKDRSAPAYMPKDGGEKTGAPGYILDAEKENFDEGLFSPAERLPGLLKAPYEGDRGDIRAGWSYQDGAWTLELARKRVTGSAYDVQFDDLEKSYFFALATFDNTQVRHAVQNGVVEFKFGK